jgi:hypothetical protein
MFAGNIGAAQDFKSILDAAEKLMSERAIQWIVLGEGRMLEWVKTQIRERGLDDNVHLLGAYPLEMMPYFFREADVMLVTLKSDPIFALTYQVRYNPTWHAAARLQQCSMVKALA